MKIHFITVQRKCSLFSLIINQSINRSLDESINHNYLIGIIIHFLQYFVQELLLMNKIAETIWTIWEKNTNSTVNFFFGGGSSGLMFKTPSRIGEKP